jgi:ubiquinone/menaquinone biosynthesis C-methylase UbiE
MSKLVQYQLSEQIEIAFSGSLQTPAYLEETYWWAYIHPKAVAFFERQWLVNLILWGNFVRLREAAMSELANNPGSRTLQISCVYGDFSVKLAERVTQSGSLDIIDVLSVQLDNVSRKLPGFDRVRTLQCNSTNLKFADASYDQAVIFFLLHEVPASVKEKTLSEALRVLKPGGKLVIVDYHQPSIFHPLRYLLPPMLKLLEPFALAIWKESIESWLPKGFVPAEYAKVTLFGGLYQKVVIRV